MDFWSRLFGSSYTPQKAVARSAVHDPQARLLRFRRVYNTFVELCNRPRNPSAEIPLFDSIRTCLDKLAALLREESRAPVPHTCLQFAGGTQIYTRVARVATVSQYEPVIRSSVAIFAALVDSEEVDFLASGHFAKSLMGLVRKVADSGNVLVDNETETAILELLFTIAAKIRLQPEILPVWFQSTAKPDIDHDHVFINEKKSFVGATQKDDFPLCYLLIDRVHHEGRIGDFARTGLLYVFEATGRSLDLETWVVSSDLPTLMASGLGALYSQLSRELSILHPDASLPAVLAMSDYTTTHTRATAESAFSERHKAHMATFLSYLAFWQDVLDHCRSADVKQTLLDHFQILFLQQLLYPSLLQSSDMDAGSSVAVLTYMTAMLEALEYPDLIHMMLTYLLAIQDQKAGTSPVPQTVTNPDQPPPSPIAVKRRQSLMLLNAPENVDDAVEPTLFNLVDLIINDVNSRNSQTVYAALKLTSAIVVRQRKYAFGTLLKVQRATPDSPARTVGALELELLRYTQLAVSLHPQYGLDLTFGCLCQDLRQSIEAQISHTKDDAIAGAYILSDNDALLRTLKNVLRTFFTNSIDVNLALTQAIISVAQCAELRLEDWLALSPRSYNIVDDTSGPFRPWQSYLDSEEQAGWSTLQKALLPPTWTAASAPMLFIELQALVSELDTVRTDIPNLDQLIAGRKNMLQAANLEDGPTSEPPSLIHSPSVQPAAFLEIPKALDLKKAGHNSGSSTPSSMPSRGRSGNSKATNNPSPHSARRSLEVASRNTSRVPSRSREGLSSSPSIFQPPPPETPSTTDMLMQVITFPNITNAADPPSADSPTRDGDGNRTASLNHVLTNVVVLQEFVLELVAVLQVRAAVLGDREVRSV